MPRAPATPLEACGSGRPLGPGFSTVTVTHGSMGAPSFGVAPGDARVLATLRTVAGKEMDALIAKVEALVRDAAERHGPAFQFSYDDVFLGCTNDPEATQVLAKGLGHAG